MPQMGFWNYNQPYNPCFMFENTLRVAILDMYDGHANQGMRSIRTVLRRFARENDLSMHVDEFDVRGKAEIADLSYDVYISSGGPGSPLLENSLWETNYFALVDALFQHNATNEYNKKYVFYICHSFQLICGHLKLGTINKRQSTSFGVMPTHRVNEGNTDNFLDGLADPFWVVDSRDWQVVNLNWEKIMALDIKVLAIEKERPNIPLDRAIMALRIGNEMFATQFHPEADPEGMLVHLQTEDKRNQVIQDHGAAKYYQMLDFLNDDDKIALTQRTILPAFLNKAIHQFQEV